MTAVALIGCDGARKTTLARALEARFPGHIRYLYMGTNASSANLALPTTRLTYLIRIRNEQRRRVLAGEAPLGAVSLHGIVHRLDNRGMAWAAARLANRLAEEVFRQVVSWSHQLRGRGVDRHFLFDFARLDGQSPRLSARIHSWFLDNLYPRPHLVLFLDAPPEVLLARKQEVPLEYRESRRRAYLAKGEGFEQFLLLDASLPADEIYAPAEGAIIDMMEQRSGNRRFRLRSRTRSPR